MTNKGDDNLGCCKTRREVKVSTIRENIEYAIENSPKLLADGSSIACQGTEGSYSQEAANKIFRDAEILFFKNFEGVFGAIEKGLCRYGILPIENSTAGSVNQIYDLMREHSFNIVQSVRIRIDHSFLVKDGTTKKDVKEIYSHEQALSQCEKYLGDYPEADLIICSNTAAAAKLVAESQGNSKAAIASRGCGELYGLKSLDRGIQDNDNNYTRFICISKDLEIYPGSDRTSLMATLPHRAGSLYEVIREFAEAGYNLTKLESRPIPNTDFEFMFYFDFESSVYRDDFIDVLERVEKLCDKMEYLGSYSEKF